MEGLLSVFCGNSSNYCSCTNDGVIIFVNFLLLIFCALSVIYMPSPRTIATNVSYSALEIVSAIFNGGLGLVYVGMGIWILSEEQSVLPLHRWLVLLFQGFTWLVVSLAIILKGRKLPKSFRMNCSKVTCIFAGIFCVLALLGAIVDKAVSIKTVADVLSLPGAIIFLLCTCQIETAGETYDGIAMYTLVNEESKVHCKDDDKSKSQTPFAKAGLLSKMSFWWLNPLMKKGKEKTLKEGDIPLLRDVDRAESCYLFFMEQLRRQKQSNPSSEPSILWAIIVCFRKEIFVSGCFALVKTLTLSVGPLLIGAFIAVGEGKESFKHEGYVLAISLLFAKCLESISQRQWYFRSRILGIRVRSLLSAAIYRKQLRLSNAAKNLHSAGKIMNYVSVDAYRVGEFPFWLHQTWSTSLQICVALVILIRAVGPATFATMGVILLTVLCNTPLAKLQQKYKSELMTAQDKRLKAMSEALVNMKVLKLYAWEMHFKNLIERLRNEEYKWLSIVQLRKAYSSILFWSSPVLVSAATFGTCYFLGVPLYASNVFTFVSTFRIVQEPIKSIPDVIGVVIDANVAFSRIVEFLGAPELQTENVSYKGNTAKHNLSISIKSGNISWEENPLKASLRNINLEVKPGEKVAICGEVGAGKSTLLAAVLGEVPFVEGSIHISGKMAYISQTAWIQSGSIQDNILFGCNFDKQRYQETLERCSLLKDLEMLPFGDLTEIGERGVNLSGGQKQRIQLARALYQDADIYLMDDPFSAVDAHTASTLFKEYVMGSLSGKTVVLVTHQVDFLPEFNSILLMSDGEILHAAPYDMLLASSKEFSELVNAHKDTMGSERLTRIASPQTCAKETSKSRSKMLFEEPVGDQLTKPEEKESGDTGFKPYLMYLNQNKGFFYFSLGILSHLMTVVGQILQNSWMAANVQNPQVSKLRLIIVYLLIGLSSTFFILVRSLSVVSMGMQSTKSLFSQLMSSLFHAPVHFYDSTPFGRIISRVSSDLSIIDLDLPFALLFSLTTAINAYSILGVLAVITWQRYYFASAKEFMRINGTTKSMIANHLAESIAGAMTIRALGEEERFFAQNLDLIDQNASPYFHIFAANEWLIQRLETLSAFVLSTSALVMVLLPPGTFGSGFIGMALSYGLSLNIALVASIQHQCTLRNYIVSVERVNQYMHIPSESLPVIEENRPKRSWPFAGRVDIQDLKVQYRVDTPLVLRGISCTFEGGHKIGIVGRTGSGKTTLIGALFRLVQPVSGRIRIDDLDISTIGLHDLRSRLGIIPQDPILFNMTVLKKCQLHESVQEKGQGLDSLVADDGTNWSVGQRQLLCLGRALLRKSRILILDEATASIDNATDSILQKTIRVEFSDCTVITVAHRIPTVMDCTMVLALSDGKLVEYDEPMKLMEREGSFFNKLVNEYWSYIHLAD
ncbi:hypothetical protein MKX03_027290 [Papaver bracteatum]|nr:hypothetical protein MKX03_027290 [Papaver bracteatum]